MDNRAKVVEDIIAEVLKMKISKIESNVEYFSKPKSSWLIRYSTKEIMKWYFRSLRSGYYAPFDDGPSALAFSTKELKCELDSREHVFNKVEGKRLRFLMSKYKMCKEFILKEEKFRNYIFNGGILS